jgi:pimeloyl-ACP methyl ester carboxylesterase
MQRRDVILPAPLMPGESPRRIATWHWGDECNPNVVLCIHGLTRNAHDFDFLASALAADFRVICPDMPGRGDSDNLTNPALYGYPVYMGIVQYLLQAFSLSRVHWVGTSMGGILGMMTAATAPNIFSSLILNDVGSLIPAAGLRRILSYAGVVTEFASRSEAEAALRKNCAPFGITEEAHWQHLFSHSLKDAGNGRWRFNYDPAIAAAFPKGDAIADIDLSAFWAATANIPTLIVRGANSDILTREIAQAMQASRGNATLHEVPNTGHAPMLMNVAETSLIRKWLLEKRGNN